MVLDFTLNLTDILTKIDTKLDNAKTGVDCADTTDNLNLNFNEIRGSLDDIAKKATQYDDSFYDYRNESEKWEKPKKYGYINGKKEFDIPLFNRFDPLISSNGNPDITNECDNNHTNHTANLNNPSKKKHLKINKNNKRTKYTKVKVLSDSILKNIGSNIEIRSNLKVSSTILSGGGVFNIHNLGFTLSETDKICVISIGGNDMKNYSINTILSELYNVLNFFKSTYPDKTFVFGSLLPRSDINSKLLAMFNYEVRKFCRLSGILFCDVFKSFSKYDFNSEGIHLNSKGINKLGLLYSSFLSKVFLLKDMI